MFNKIVRVPMLEEDPVIIKVEKTHHNSADNAEEEEEEESGFDEETLNNMLAEIAAKEQRAIQKLKDADTQSEIIMQAAKNEGKQILDNARSEADEMKVQAVQKGHEEGYKDGHEEGIKAAKKELADTIKQANAKAEKTLKDAKAATADYFVKAEQDIANIVMLAIEKILPQHFLDVPQVVLPVVREAIKNVRDQKDVKVHVCPDSYDMVLMGRAEFQSMLTDGTAVLEVVSDESLSPGDCVIETPNGGVDARLLTQIELMKNSIQSILIK